MTTTNLEKRGNHGNDDWETPYSAVELLSHHISVPKNARIWDPFFCTGRAKANLSRAFPGRRVVHMNKDFFTYVPQFDVIITNPPHSIVSKVVKRIMQFGKPFALLIKTRSIYSKYMKNLVKEKGQFRALVSPTRIAYINPKLGENAESAAMFESFWLTYKMPIVARNTRELPLYFA